jgi:hypothetical protein
MCKKDWDGVAKALGTDHEGNACNQRFTRLVKQGSTKPTGQKELQAELPLARRSERVGNGPAGSCRRGLGWYLILSLSCTSLSHVSCTMASMHHDHSPNFLFF